MKKRGIAFALLIGLIAGLIGFLAIVGVIYVVFFPFAQGIGGDFFCHFSLMFRSASKEPPLFGFSQIATGATEASGTYENYPVYCKPSVKKIKASDSDEKVMKVIADKMGSCWWKLGEGKYDFYSDFGWDGKKDMCLICSEIRMRDEGTKKITSSEMEEYLYSETYQTQGVSYAHYITGTGKRIGASASTGTLEITENKPLYVVFRVNKLEDLLSKGGRIAGGWAETNVALAATGARKILLNIPVQIGILTISAANSIFTNKGFNANVYLYSAQEVAGACSQLT